MISNLEELVLGCADESVRSGIEEAIKCYQGGAYRAAIVSAYVTVCFDLIEKLKALAASGDGDAKVAVTRLEALQEQLDRADPNAIKGLLSFERELLELFRDKLEFLGKNEFDDLNRLREDRNRCAHPTFFKSSLPFAPSAELARLHLRNSLVHVLTKSPKQGRAALDSLEAVVLSSYFPTILEDVVARLRGTELMNARPALIRSFVDRFVFGLADESSSLFKKRPARIAVEAIIELHRAEALPRLVININKLLVNPDSNAVLVGTMFALWITEAGEQVDEAGKAVMRTWVQKPPEEGNAGNVVCNGLAISWLRETMVDVLKSLSAREMGSITVTDVPPEVTDYAAKKFGSARSWAEANLLADEFAINLASKFREHDLRFVFNAAAKKEADLLGSTGFDQFLLALCTESEAKKEQIIRLLEEFDLGNFAPSNSADTAS